MASVSDKITKVKDGSNPNVARVVTPRPANSDTLSVDSLTGWTEDTAVHFMTYRVDSTGKVVPGSQRDWKGMANKATGQIISLQIQNNAIDDGNLVGDIVQAGPTASWAQDLAEAMLESHKSDGSLKKGAVGAENIAKDSIVAESIKEKSITADKIDFTTMPDNKYSTDEINTGKKWINGKTIFQKTFAMGGLGVATTIKKPHNISNLDMVVRIQGIAKENSIGATINLPHAADQQPYTVTVYVDNTNVNIQTYADQRGYAQSYVTLWYTKK